jgi:chemotaxis signal transduction protein
MLILLITVAGRRCGLDARDVVEVLPCVPLQALADAPEGVSGALRHRAGNAVVIDPTGLPSNTSAPPLLSTRLVLLQPPELAAPLALRVDQATQIVRIDAPAGARGDTTLPDGSHVELVGWSDLIPPPLQEAMSRSTPA